MARGTLTAETCTVDDDRRPSSPSWRRRAGATASRSCPPPRPACRPCSTARRCRPSGSLRSSSPGGARRRREDAGSTRSWPAAVPSTCPSSWPRSSRLRPALQPLRGEHHDLLCHTRAAGERPGARALASPAATRASGTTAAPTRPSGARCGSSCATWAARSRARQQVTSAAGTRLALLRRVGGAEPLAAVPRRRASRRARAW